MLIPFWRYIYIILQSQSHKKVTTQLKPRLFFIFFACWLEGSGPIQINYESGFRRTQIFGFGTQDRGISIVHERPERSWLICETCPARSEGEPPPTSLAEGPGFLNQGQKINKRKRNIYSKAGKSTNFNSFEVYTTCLHKSFPIQYDNPFTRVNSQKGKL